MTYLYDTIGTPGGPNLQILDASPVSEGGVMVFTIGIAGGLSASPLTIPLAYSGTAVPGTDYNAGPASVVLPGNATTVNVSITTKHNAASFVDKILTVTIGPVAGVAISDASGSGTIVNTDASVSPPVASFTGVPVTGQVPLGVTFTDTSTNAPTSWTWTFGDGGASNAQNPVYEYDVAGIYTVVMTATNAAGSDTVTRSNYITVSAPAVLPPVADFTQSPSTGVAPLLVSFIDTSTHTPTSWLWTFGDGNNSTQQNPQHTYSTAGDYTVGLTATNAAGGNTVTKPSLISVSAPVLPVISIDSLADVNEGSSAQFTISMTGGTVPTDVTVNLGWSGTANNSTDVALPLPTQATILANETEASVSIVTKTDTIADGNKILTCTLTNPPATVTIGDAIGSVTIVDVPPVMVVSIATPESVNEGDTLVFPINLSGTVRKPAVMSANPITVDLAWSGTANNTTDVTLPLPTQATILAGTTQALVSVVTKLDGVVDGTKTLTCTISNPTSGATLGTAVASGTIYDVDVAGIDFYINDALPVDEGGVLTYGMHLTAPAPSKATIHVTYSGTAVEGVNYIAGPATIDILAGNTQGDLPIQTIDDGIVDSDKTLIVNVNNITGHTIDIIDGQATGTIYNTNSTPTTINEVVSQRKVQTFTGNTPNFIWPAIPSEGDLMVLSLACRNQDAYTINSPGWTEAGGTDGVPGDTIKVYTYYKIAGPAEPQNFSATTGGSPCAVGGTNYSGVNQSTPFDVAATNAGQAMTDVANIVSLPAIQAPGELIFTAWAAQQSDWAGYTNGLEQVVQGGISGGNSANRIQLAIATKIAPDSTAQEYGAATSLNVRYAAVASAFKP